MASTSKNDNRGSKRMFRDPSGQSEMFEKSLEEEMEARLNQPVECLGMTFPNDDARREYFLDKLREKLQDPEFRKIEGFPIGDDADILAMSDPPYYTACPNPFLKDFIRHYGKPFDPNEPYNRKPFAVDVSEGKTDQLYRAHAYHTKVPHLAIVPSILHYTEPGDLVLDGFCGSGMTGVAAQWCGAAPEDYRRKLEADWGKEGRPKPNWGARRVVLNDLSPAATFIAANYNLPFDVDEFARAGQRILKEVEDELGWMYETLHSDGKTKGRIEYTVWSEVFTCPECSGEVVFLNEALDQETKRVRDTFPCPHCRASLAKNNLERVFETLPDPITNQPWKRLKYQPSLIFYVINGTRYEKRVDKFDLDVINKINGVDIPKEVPTDAFQFDDMWEAPRLEKKGFSHIHLLFFRRAAISLAVLWRKADRYKDRRLRNVLLFFIEQAIWGMSIMARYVPTHYSQVNQYLAGAYYVASQHAECSPWYILNGKLKRLISVFKNFNGLPLQALITTNSTSDLELSSNSIDYIFTDPPFGDNYPYSELNFLVESWHGTITNPNREAVVDRAKRNKKAQKKLPDYTSLMRLCFDEYYRLLRPGRWMTLVFSNSKNAVWHAIQEALNGAGFVIADVRTLNKKQGSFKQVTSMAVKQDLVISAYKPNGGLEERFQIEAGTEEGVWDFIRTHLKQLPVFVPREGRGEVLAERQDYLLYDRMVAFHVQRGVTVPLSASEFYQGLEQRFSERDGMYFLPEQVAEYDKKRLTVKDVEAPEFAPVDEFSAIRWLQRLLRDKPQSFQDIQPKFMREIVGWQKHEKPLELSELLEQNFLRYDGKGEVPSQIHSYLSSNFKELRGLPKDAPALCAKGKDRWYVPDPNKAGDLEKLRERALLKEFWEYLPPGYEPAKPDSGAGFLPGLGPHQVPLPRSKKIKVIRLEAVRVGFKYCWQNRDYRTIVAVAQRIPEAILQEDSKLLMWYDQAVTRTGDDQ